MNNNDHQQHQPHITPYSLDGNIYNAVFNPPGEHNDKLTTYLTQYQLDETAKKLEGIPVYIEHVLHNKDGDPIQPCGVVLCGRVNDNKKLYGSFVLNDTQNGLFAKHLIEHYGMNEVSLGYEIKQIKDTKTGLSIPFANKVKEVSLCFKGAREGTQIKKVVSIKEIIESAAKKV
jgi:hypothetical protein